MSVVIVLLLGWVTLAFAQPPAEVTLSRVRDGDTLEVQDAAKTIYVIRLIGTRAPERYEMVPCARRWADRATAYVTRVVTGQPLRLAFDVDPLDAYGRWLAYVYQGDDMLNALLLQHGLARVGDSGKNRQHRAWFQTLEDEAFRQQRGLWGD